MRRATGISRLTTILIFGAFLALGVGANPTAQMRGRVTGKIVDAEGKAVGNVTIRFTSKDGKGTPRTVTVRKKGRFAQPGLPGGRYRVDLVESDLYVTSVEYNIRRDDGLTVSAGRIEGTPRDGVTGVPVSDQDEVLLTLVVAPKGSADAGEGEMVLSSPELNAAAKLYNQAEYQQTVDEAKRVLAGNPESGEASYVQGVALEKLGRYAEAEAALQRAASRIPDFPRIWAALGEVSMSLAAEQESSDDAGEARLAYGRAAESLTQAVERDPDALPLQLNLAASLDRAGAHDRLVQVLERILVQDPANMQSRLRLASLYSRQGRHDSAMALLREIPATEKRAAVTIYNIAVGLNDDGDTDGALIAARRAAEIDPQLSHPKRLIAQLLLAKGDHPAAIDAIRTFLELAPDDPEAEAYRRILKQLEEQ